MSNAHKIHPEYITDEHGKKKSVILPIGEFEELMNDLADLAAVAERRKEPTIDQSMLIESLKKDGIL